MRISDLRRYRRHMTRELDNASLYRALAGSAEGEHREVLLELAAAEQRHAQFWQAKLRELGVAVPAAADHRPGVTARFLAWFGRRLGVRRVVPLLERLEAGERTRYDDEAEATTTMMAEERIHAELVASLAPAWRSRASSSIRAAVFGVNDGLVSNLSLVMGMAGGQASTTTVLLAGMAGLVAGAGSMGAGEYISVKSQRELVEAGTRLGPAELAVMAERDPVAFELLARTWVFDDTTAAPPPPDTTGDVAALGSPLAAALYSSVAFSAGAAIPVLPFFVIAGAAALAVAAALAGVALFFVGAAISLITNRGVVRSGLRQLAVGAIAAMGTYAVGRAVGASLP
ncbi:MAG: VIT1/CCC1 transporter family protein [Acidimicrobiales bacterium]